MKKVSLFLKSICGAAFFLILFSACSVVDVSGSAAKAKADGTVSASGSVLNVPLETPVVTATVSGTTVTVSWGAIDHSAGYEVVFMGPTDIPAVSVGDGFTGLSVTRDNIAPGNYTVKVRALADNIDKLYQSGPFSDDVPFVIGSVVSKIKLATPVISAAVSYSAPFVTGLAASVTSIWPVNKAMVQDIISGNVDTGKGIVNISWTDVDAPHVAGYQVTFDGVVIQTATVTGVSAGIHTITVTALAGNSDVYLDSDPAVATVNVLPGSATYTVIDEYPSFYTGKVGNGEVKQVVSCSAGPLPFVSPMTIPLQAWRYGQDMDGRYYIITVSAVNADHSAGAQSSVTVTVPHNH